MANPDTGKLKTALAVLVVVGIADLALLNLYAAPRYVAEQAAVGGATSPAGPVARLDPPTEPSAQHPTPPPVSEPTAEEPAAAATEEPVEEPAEEPTAEPEPEEPPPEPPVASSAPDIPDLTFGTGAASLQKRSKDLLFQVAKHMRATPRQKVLLQGHADLRGPDSLNSELSLQRARAAAAHLIELGVPKSRIQIEGLGETQPADRGNSAASLARNRRVVIVWQ